MTDARIARRRLMAERDQALASGDIRRYQALTKQEVEAGLDRLERQFMVPDIQGPMTVISYDDPHDGTVYRPSEYAYEADVPAAWADTIERHEGKYLARLTAPGYLDQTDTTMHDTYDEAAAYLVETYDDSDDSETGV